MSFEYQFPDPRTADPDGLLAAGGDLSVESLVTAYSKGIFPWYSEGSPILWWSPDPRLVLFPQEFSLSASLEQRIRTGKYTPAIDNDFESVIRQCASVKRSGQNGTWITEAMIKAYSHPPPASPTFETYYNGELAGGPWCITGQCIFGESFSARPSSSPVGLITWA
jgi:leucyl/phenylalanyl-tRNA--protein transferase